MKVGPTKPLLIAFALLCVMVSSLKLSDIVELRKKLRKMESGELGLPEGRKLAEIHQANKDSGKEKQNKDAGKQKLAKKAAVKASKKKELAKQAPKKAVVKASKKAAADAKSNNRNLRSLDATPNQVAAPQQTAQQQLDNGVAPTKLEKTSQQIQEKNNAGATKLVKTQDDKNSRSLKQYRHASLHGNRKAKRRYYAVKKAQNLNKRRRAVLAKRARLNRQKKGKKAKKGKNKKVMKKKKSVKSGKKKNVSKAQVKRGGKVFKAHAKNLRDVPVGSHEKESLALDAINHANNNAKSNAPAATPAERKLVDLPSQNEFYEQIISNYYPTI